MLRILVALLLFLPWSLLPAEEIPLEHCDNLLVVQVSVSGTGFLFLVDTAAVSMLNVKSFGHGEPFKAAVQSWNGTIETRAQEIVIRDLAIGHHHFNNLRLTAVDLSAIGHACGRRVDGILGIDLLAQMGATLDVKKQSAHLTTETETFQARVAELMRQLAGCEQAFNRGDEPAFADCLDPQIVLFAFGGDYYGREAAMDYYRERYFRQRPPARLSFTPLAHHAIGEAIWVEGDLRLTMGDRVITARATALCQKENGKWRIVHQAHSTVLAETTQAADTR
jgi:ketosteroid isomerase-like protein